MGATFLVRMKTEPAFGQQQNINWQPSSGGVAAMNSSPDMLSGTGPVYFIDAPTPGRLALNAITASSGTGFVDALVSPEFPPVSGATYVWDTASNSVAVVIAQPFSQEPNAWIDWAKANPLKAGLLAAGVYVVGKGLFGGRRGGLF